MRAHSLSLLTIRPLIDLTTGGFVELHVQCWPVQTCAFIHVSLPADLCFHCCGPLDYLTCIHCCVGIDVLLLCGTQNTSTGTWCCYWFVCVCECVCVCELLCPEVELLARNFIGKCSDGRVWKQNHLNSGAYDFRVVTLSLCNLPAWSVTSVVAEGGAGNWWWFSLNAQCL